MTEPRTQPLIAQSSPSTETAPFFPGVVEPGLELLPPPFVDPPDCELELEPEFELELPLPLLLPELSELPLEL
jgi:hypothetical protein